MYYPLLRARQFELIALRELALEGASQEFICPILEPVRKALNNLNLAYKVFVEKNQKSYLIVNPGAGELAGDGNYYLEYLQSTGDLPVRPAFIYRSNSAYIRECIQNFGLQDCMLIFQNEISTDNEEFRELAGMPEVGAISLQDPGKNRGLDRFLKRQGKTYIRLDDLFEKQLRNSDFLGIEEHKFSEEHLYFREENFNGFSDYTILPSEFSEGGSTPRAVVIHLTYRKNDDQIWIRHFTSQSNDSIANIQGKFGEAAEKAVRFCREHNLTNSAILELEGFYDREHYPGLGSVKKVSIKNHLLVVSDYLRSIQ